MIENDDNSYPLLQLFKETFGNTPDSIEQLTGSGSNRGYYRLTTNNLSVIGVKGEIWEENHAFIEIGRLLHNQGLPVPEIYRVSGDEMYYLQEDLGNVSLFDVIQKEIPNGFTSPGVISLLEDTLKRLAEIQVRGMSLDFKICYPDAEFDEMAMMWDLNYFKYCFLKHTGVPFNERKLELEFKEIARITNMKRVSQTFMYRDFQSRNVMIYHDKPYMIDFQGGRKGPYLYDAVSFLWQAKAQFPDRLREELYSVYETSLRELGIRRPALLSQFRPYYVLLRQLQTLGAYGFRGFGERKSHFLESVPFALKEVMKTLDDENFHSCYYLREVMKAVCEKYVEKTDGTKQ